MITAYYETKRNGRTVRVPVAPTVAANVPQRGMVVECDGEKMTVYTVRHSAFCMIPNGRATVIYWTEKSNRYSQNLFMPLWQWRSMILAQHMRDWCL